MYLILIRIPMVCYIGIDKGRKITARFPEELEDSDTSIDDNANNSLVQSKDITNVEEIKDKKDTNRVDKVIEVIGVSGEVIGVAHTNKPINEIAINTI